MMFKWQKVMTKILVVKIFSIIFEESLTNSKQINTNRIMFDCILIDLFQLPSGHGNHCYAEQALTLFSLF